MFMKSPLIISLLLSATIGIHAQSVTYTYDSAGNRTARVIILNKSPQAQKTTTVLPDLIAEKAIVIYPNPTDGILTVEIKDYTDDVQADFRLTDLSGRLISSRKATSATQTFDLSRQTAGIYLLQIRIDGESTVWKIIKK
jgi:hypothetical protein